VLSTKQFVGSIGRKALSKERSKPSAERQVSSTEQSVRGAKR